MKEDEPEHEITRVELVRKPYCKLFELLDKPNPFANLTISTHTNLIINNDTCWNLFLDSCRLRGANSALFKIKDSSFYDKFKARLLKGQTDWWKPDKVWSQLPSVLANIANIHIPENHAA